MRDILNMGDFKAKVVRGWCVCGWYMWCVCGVCVLAFVGVCVVDGDHPFPYSLFLHSPLLSSPPTPSPTPTQGSSSPAMRISGANVKFVQLVGLGPASDALVTSSWGPAPTQALGVAVATGAKTVKATSAGVVLVDAPAMTGEQQSDVATKVWGGGDRRWWLGVVVGVYCDGGWSFCKYVYSNMEEVLPFPYTYTHSHTLVHTYITLCAHLGGYNTYTPSHTLIHTYIDYTGCTLGWLRNHHVQEQKQTPHPGCGTPSGVGGGCSDQWCC